VQLFSSADVRESIKDGKAISKASHEWKTRRLQVSRALFVVRNCFACTSQMLRHAALRDRRKPMECGSASLLPFEHENSDRVKPQKKRSARALSAFAGNNASALVSICDVFIHFSFVIMGNYTLIKSFFFSLLRARLSRRLKWAIFAASRSLLLRIVAERSFCSAQTCSMKSVADWAIRQGNRIFGAITVKYTSEREQQQVILC
jgi:hypothetical protein